MKSIPLPVFLFFLFITHLPAQTVRFVDQNAAGNGNGSSWANAYTLFQQALTVAQDGDEIWIAKGTYKPTATNNRFAFYDLPSGVKVYGGFEGTETLREQRDWVANPCILSGDIGNVGDSTDNSFNILYSYSPSEKTHLDGLIFEEANANNTDFSVGSHRPTRSGGGLYLDGENFGYAQLSVSNCIFRRNRANYQGGGVYANGRDGGMAIVRLENCLFERNVSEYYGGGFSLENYFEQPFALELKGCEFRENYALYGVAVWLRSNQSVSFTNCKFFNHQYNNLGQTIALELMGSNHPLTFSHCVFHKNDNNIIRYSPNSHAPNDAEFYFKSCIFSENGLPTIFNNVLPSTKTIAKFEQCIFQSNKLNTSNSSIGSLFFIGGTQEAGTITFTNSLFYKNIAHEITFRSADIRNCIFIDDLNQNATSKGVIGGIGPFRVSNSLFSLPNCQSLAITSSTPPTILCDSTNLYGLDPRFVNPSLSDFHLQPCSPAINRGMNDILDTLGITSDLDGNPRIRNEVVDMGPYETNISLNPSISGTPACAGENTGAIKLSPNICPSYSFFWSNGVTTGTNTNGLSAGTYIFTILGSNNIPVYDTIVLSEPLPVSISAEVKNAHCYGESSGQLETFVSGGTPTYQYHWDPPLPPVSAHFNLPAGLYALTATDVKGCTGSTQASIGSPDSIQYFFSTQDASCIGCSDGSIVFDSVVGGTNPPLPDPMFDLAAGSYCLTLTDAAGCAAIPCFTIGVISDVSAKTLIPAVKLSPNPTAFGESVSLKWIDSEGVTLRVWDLQGIILEEKRLAPNTTVQLQAKWPSGVYNVEIRTDSGKRAVQRWVIF